MQAMRFEKYEGLGNDFVLVEADRDDVVSPALARAICDRRFGVGGDGVLLLLPPLSPGASARMRVINSDGSVPEMCGNGLRCAALHLHHAGRGNGGGRAERERARGPREIVVDTDSGAKACVIGDSGDVTVDMGEVRVGGEVTIDLDGEPWTFTTADAGNPHAITTRAAPRERLLAVGPRVASHPSFPDGTNVELARFGDRRIVLDVWERGAGATLACGTGACAAAAVGVARGAFRADEEIRVELPGGVLAVTITPAGRASMRGPARHVFTGEFDRDAYERVG